MLQPNKRLKFETKRPGGFILVVVLVVLTLLTGFGVVWTQRVMLQHRQTNLRTFAVQADWLASSALQRAIAQLANNNDYQGETWQLSAAELLASHDAKIEIKVSKGEQPNSREIEVLVDYPEDPLLRQRVRARQQLLFSQLENENPDE